MHRLSARSVTLTTTEIISAAVGVHSECASIVVRNLPSAGYLRFVKRSRLQSLAHRAQKTARTRVLFIMCVGVQLGVAFNLRIDEQIIDRMDVEILLKKRTDGG